MNIVPNRFGEYAGTLLLKILIVVVILRFFSWKGAVFFWLVANLVGTSTVVLWLLRWTWWCVSWLGGDNYYMNIVLVAVWSLHELNLINVPGIWR